MEATDVRIGNYVYDTKGEINKINLAAIEYLLRYGSSGACQVKPIPLTEDMLKKCGFEKSGEFIFDHPSGVVFDAPNDWNNTDEYPIEIGMPRTVMGYNPEELIIRCLYLHDLQNKFFAITGEELEINLQL